MSEDETALAGPGPGKDGDEAAPPAGGDRLGPFRARVARLLVLASLGLGLVLLVPSLADAWATARYALFAADLVAYFGLLCLAVLDRGRRRFSSYGIVLLAFAQGFFLYAYRGPAGAGESWFCSAVVLAAILFGARGGLALAGIVSLSFGGLGLAAVRGLLRWSAAGSYLAILALNTVTLALVAGLAAASLVRSLRKALEAGERLRAELAEGKAALEREAEERRGAERLAEFYRDHDGRTGLPNRERFLYELGRAARSAERRKRLLAVLAVGVDEPGRLYDEYGHAASEAALAEAALALKESFREDDLVARFDETHLFVLCENLNDSGDAGELIRKAKGSFARPFRAEGAATAAATDGAGAGPAGAAGPAMAAAGAGMSLSASVGLAFYPHDGAGPEALLEAARAALRLAEESGPGSYRLFDAHLHAGLIARIRYGRELEAAVEEGLLVPWFQPKVDAGRRIVGAEALARWPRDDGPTRMPSDFIPAAERQGAIGRLGLRMLRLSCLRAAAVERASGRGLVMAVNVSPLQLADPGFPAEIRAILAETGLAPRLLELEVTETGLASMEGQAALRLAELKALGLRLAIDDFGTGASAIARLKDYPVDSVKIPKQFVDHLPEEGRAPTIVRAVIDLAHRLGFATVAEGVETEAQFEWLKSASCDEFQGFLFSRPLPADAFEAELARAFPEAVE
ncbi:MAG TPA: bifunctional diguanylate cyclase/phosphodiesterase [Spirochaetia bacterium]|nr:bifunctional diguanylate cyclase/phosphodiesterase [Spirochaetia bacterium]